MFNKTFFILLGLSSLLLFGCNSVQVRPSTEMDTSISTDIIKKSDEYIISQVGTDFFTNYISFNQESSQYYPADDYCVENPNECSIFLQEPNYLMVYSLKIPEKPYVDGVIEIVLDEEGKVITEREPSGVPNCIADPTECEFPIDEAAAVKIAEEAGLGEGIKEWVIGSVHWYGGDLNSYVWTISNTLTEDEAEATGRTVVIDANTGELVEEIGNWIRQS